MNRWRAVLIALLLGAIAVSWGMTVGTQIIEGLTKSEKPNIALPLLNVVQIKCEVTASQNYYAFGGWQGTGVFIDDDLIITAGHIVDGIVDANVITVDGIIYKAESWYLCTEADIGFIRIKTPKVERKLNFDNAVLGEVVWAYGNPLGVFPVLTKGIISAINAKDDYGNTKDMIITDSAINGGNSGCPLFDEQGNILGICSWGYNNSQGMSYFVRAEICKLLLTKFFAVEAVNNAD